MKELITLIARALVDYPDEVKVTEISGEQTTVLELQVAKSDIGKVIGKDGQTIRAIRMLLYSMIPQGQDIEITVAK